MKAVLRFDLDDPDDAMAHLRCVKATEMASLLWDLQQLWRKYKHMDVHEEEWEGMDRVIKDIRNLFEESGLVMDDLMR